MLRRLPAVAVGGPELWLAESTAGVAALRACLDGLTVSGGPAVPGPPRRSGSASIPSGSCTSRSYAPPYGLLARHAGAVGVDIEQVVPLEPEFATSVCTPEELAAPPRTGADAVLFWSGKEALAKALGDARRYDPRQVGSPARWPAGRSGRWRYDECPAPPGFVITVVWADLADPGEHVRR